MLPDQTFHFFAIISALGILVFAGLGVLLLVSTFRRGSGGQRLSKSVTDLVRTLALVGIGIFGIFLLIEMYLNLSPDFVLKAAEEHFLAVIGAPMAALAALFLVLVLRATAGPIEFEVVGVKAKGAAGPLFFWVLCFLAMIVAMKLLW